MDILLIDVGALAAFMGLLAVLYWSGSHPKPRSGRTVQIARGAPMARVTCTDRTAGNR